MNLTEKEAVDRLLFQITDGGLEEEAAVDELAELLLGRPDLQDYYRHAVTMNSLLELEYAQTAEGTRPISDLNQPHALLNGFRDKLTAQAEKGALVAAPIQQYSSTRQRKLRGGYAALAIAGALMLAALPFLARQDSQETQQVAKRGRIWSPQSSAGSGVSELSVSDQRSLRLIDKLTRHPFVSDVVLPRTSYPDSSHLTLCSGNAWIYRLPNSRERGYLVALPAGCLMEVDIDTEARGDNSLAVVEISPSGVATGESLLFDNYSSEAKAALERVNLPDKRLEGLRGGRLGNFSKRNPSSQTKYYLFTGSYSVTDVDGAQQWLQSDYKIQLDLEDTLVIGWDDSGYVADPDVKNTYAADRDFNDMRAVLRFSFPGEKKSRSKLSKFLPKPLPPTPDASIKTGIGHTFDVYPGDTAMLSVGSYAAHQNSFRVIDIEAGRVLWKDQGRPHAPGVMQLRDRGFYLIRNNTETVQRYEIQGHHKPSNADDSDAWRVSPSRVLAEDKGWTLLGFEDSPGTSLHVDWQDLYVYIRVFHQ